MLRGTDLAMDPLVPEDISAGGFRITITHRPSMGSAVPFSIRVGKNILNGCTCRVVWARNDLDKIAPWTVGLSADFSQKQLDNLLYYMTEALAKGELEEKESSSE